MTAGSRLAIDAMLGPESVRSAHGEKSTADDGCGRPSPNAAISVATARPAPADSPATANFEASTPLFRSPR